MPSVSTVYLVDTNVFIYAVAGEDYLKSERSRAVLGQIVDNRAGCVSTQVLNETFSVLTSGIRDERKIEEAELVVNTIISQYEVFETTLETVLEAIRGARRYQLPIWDGLIWAAARLNGISYVLSEDFSSGQTIDGVTFLNPLSENFAVERLDV